jgi:DNA polymerase-1
MTPTRILIFDGLNTFLRNFVVNPAMDLNGEHIGGLLGMLRSVKLSVRDVKPDLVIVVWDGQGGSLRRRGIRADYKAGRKPRVNREFEHDDPQQALRSIDSQRGRLKGLLNNLGVVQIELDDVEADDVIGYLCKQIYPAVDKVVVSTDQDFWQLVDDRTQVYSPTRKTYFNTAELRKETGVLPENFIYVKALKGDGSDNIKGIKGIGPKTAVKLFPFMGERATDLNEIIEHARANAAKNPKYRVVSENSELLRENVKLMQLSNPTMSETSARVVRCALNVQLPKFVLSEFKLILLRDGIQLTDNDLFPVFRDYQLRAQKV